MKGKSINDPILVVDDDPLVREMTMAYLSDLGYQVQQADDILTARSLLRSQPFSLVLCDYEMPGGSGLDLLDYLSRVYPHLPFLMLSAHQEAELGRETIARGGLDFLTKPFDFQQLARVIEQNWARLERDRKRAAELTNDILTETIRALVAAVDAKDPHTAHHSERVRSLSLRLGEAMGLTDEGLRILGFAALLHDVGKIGVPESILLKPGPLSEGEWEIVQRHPGLGAEIVGQVQSLGEIATIIRHHHERMDGGGYPDGLSGEAIPLMSRVIALADTYEALTAHRAYRPSHTVSEAREMIRAELGRYFDRGLGERFLQLPDLP